MKRAKKKIAVIIGLLLITVMTAGLLSGCGRYDPRNYVRYELLRYNIEFDNGISHIEITMFVENNSRFNITFVSPVVMALAYGGALLDMGEFGHDIFISSNSGTSLSIEWFIFGDVSRVELRDVRFEFDGTSGNQSGGNTWNGMAIVMVLLSLLVWLLIAAILVFLIIFIYVKAANDHKKNSNIKRRSVVFVITISVITLGIYTKYWRAKFHMEVKDATGHGVSPLGNYLLLLFVPFYSLYWSYVTSKRLSGLDNNKNIDVQLNLGIILYPLRLSASDRAILALLTGGVILLQAQANELEDRHGGTLENFDAAK